MIRIFKDIISEVKIFKKLNGFSSTGLINKKNNFNS